MEPAPAEPTLAALTSRVFAGVPDIARRLDISRGRIPDYAGLISRATGWQQLFPVLKRIIQTKQPVLVYGDYDVDGITSTFLLHRWLRSQQVPGNCFIPSRFQHGYGLDAEVIRSAAEQGYQVLFALDCGAANAQEIRLARELGLEVAVIDHHTVPGDGPGVPMLNPHGESGLPPLCTAGLIYGVLGILHSEFHTEPEPDELELAGLATIADVVALEPYNWGLAHHALTTIAETENHGLAALIRISGLHGLTRLTARNLAFEIIPRINAAGRMQHGRAVLDLLAADRNTAGNLARHLDNLNRQRKKVAERDTRDALTQALNFQQDPGLVLAGEEWHPGVLGIVAAKVVNVLDRPTVVLAQDPGNSGQYSGSARSDGRTDLIAALRKCEDVLVSCGGHAQAAGVKVRQDRIDEFRMRWVEAVPEAGLSVQPERELPRARLGDLTSRFEEELWQLAPFGQGYKPSAAVLEGCRVERVSLMGRDKTHINLSVEDEHCRVKLKGFTMSHLKPMLKSGQPVNPIVEFETDNWNNRLTVMLRLIGLE